MAASRNPRANGVQMGGVSRQRARAFDFGSLQLIYHNGLTVYKSRLDRICLVQWRCLVLPNVMMVIVRRYLPWVNFELASG